MKMTAKEKTLFTTILFMMAVIHAASGGFYNFIHGVLGL